MIIVTGIGRSGTSMMIKWLASLGLDIGSDTWFDRVNAGLENEETIRINEKLITRYVKGAKINHWTIWGRILDLPHDAVKDPRFLTDQHIIKEWNKARADIHVIYMDRKAEHIATSMRRYPEWNTPVYRLFPEMANKKREEFLTMCAKINVPIKVFRYPDVLNNGEDVIEQLWEWLEKFNEGKIYPHQLITKEKALEKWNQICKR